VRHGGQTRLRLEEKVGQRTDDWQLVAIVWDKGQAEYLVRLLNKFQTEVWDPSMFGGRREE
jgi:hypothetical protein